MKLFSRYNRINLTLMVLVFLLSSIVYYYLLRYVLIHELDEDLYDRKQKIERFVKAKGTLPDTRDLDDIRVTYTLAGMPGKKTAIQQVSLFDPEEGKNENFRELVYDQVAGSTHYTVRIAKPIEGTRALLRVIVGITITTILIIILLSILLNRVLLRKLWQPFYETISAIRLFKLSKGKELALPDTDIDEFLFLQDNLSKTIHHAQEEYYLLKEFTENASHELQTPLAIIRSKLDLLIQEEDLSEKQSELLKQTYGAIKKLSRLNQSLLLLTKIENRQFPAVEHIDLEEKLEEKIQQLQELWANMQIRLTVELAPTVLEANPELVDILLNNLLSNAIRHNVEGGAIRISLTKKELVIANTGQPAALDTKRLFRRFYKAEQPNSSNGLGLSIAKEICDQSQLLIHYAYKDQYHTFWLLLP